MSTIDIFRSYIKEYKGWVCECGASFDKSIIEMKLNEWLQKQIDYHLSQDLYCDSCKMVKMDYLKKICDCGGYYVKTKDKIISYNTIFLDEVKRNFVNFKKLAQDAKMPLLEYYVESLVATKKFSS